MALGLPGVYDQIDEELSLENLELVEVENLQSGSVLKTVARSGY